VSKLNDVETVETVEGAEAARNGYEEKEAVTPDEHIVVDSKALRPWPQTAMHAEAVQKAKIRKRRVQSRVSCRCPHAQSRTR
jgi:hypothetical protein